MKHLLFVTLVALIPLTINAQFVVENVNHIDKAYKPFFSKESASINFDLFRSFTIGLDDSSYFFTISVTNTNYTEEGYSVGVGLAFGGRSSASAVSASAIYSKQENEGTWVVSRDTLQMMVFKANELFVHALKRHEYRNIAIHELGKLKIGVESGGGYSKKYFIGIGDAIFPMDDAGFRELIFSVQSAISLWDELEPKE